MIEALPSTAWVFAALLVVTGAIKLVRPEETERALRSVGIGTPHGSGRLIGLIDVGVGLSAFVLSGPIPSVALSVLYLGFGIFIVLALRSDGVVRSCGCIGRSDTPPTPLHLVLNMLGFLSGVLAAMTGGVAWSSGPVAETLLAALATVVAVTLAYFIVATPMSGGTAR